jgi:site-specific recombinase XerD
MLTDRKDRLCYEYLPKYYGDILDYYLSTLPLGKSRFAVVKQHCARFLRYLENKGISKLTTLDRSHIEGFINDHTHNDADICFKDVSGMLTFLSKQQFIADSDLHEYKELLVPTPPPDVLSEAERDGYLKLAQTDKVVLELSEYDCLVDKYLVYLTDNDYSATMKAVSRQAFSELRFFLLLNNINYSVCIAKQWIYSNKNTWVPSKYINFRRSISCLESLALNYDIKQVYSYKDTYNIPEWSIEKYEEYYNIRKSELLSNSTLSSIKASCYRLIQFLEKKGVSSWNEITPQTVKDFIISYQHYDYTPAGLNCTTSKIRGFLNYLADKDIVSSTLSSALPYLYAKKVGIVEILTEEQVAAIYKYRNLASTPYELRDSAILMLGLTIGIRSSDIVNIRFSDISWDDATLSILQLKTKTRLLLPLSTEAGNSLWCYIKDGRPKLVSKTDCVFISHRAPFEQISVNCCRSALDKSLGNVKPAYGFHILRKTFASRLLAYGSNPEEIASSLGHSGTSSIDVYLSTDDDKMKLCAIDLCGLDYSGKFNL